MSILKFKDQNGNFVDVPVIEGKQGPKGDPGQTGANGKDGKTPVLGVDYWTEKDKAEVQNYCNRYIDNQLGTINEQLASLTEVK